MHDFRGKTAVVTGAASGIGRGLAARFAKAGMNVVLSDIEEGALKHATAVLEQEGHKAIGVVTDTMKRDSVQQLFEKSVDVFDKVHILCNNAGVASLGEARPVWEIGDTDWEWVMGVNFWGVLYGLQAFVPHMLEHGEESHIVNTASLAGLMPGGGVYGVSKHGVLALSEGLHRNLKESEAKIGASVLCPGFVNTRIFDAERNRPADLKRETEDMSDVMRSAAESMLQLGKQPEEIADIVFESIEQNLFYILPHPAWDDFVRRRVEHVLARGAPVQMDFEEMMKRRAAGEQF